MDGPAEVVLLTGFGPFGPHRQNPTEVLARELDGQRVAGRRVVGLVLPVVYGEDTALVEEALATWQPAAVLALGLAAGSPDLRVERLAVNLSMTEQAGEELPIVADGPAAYLASSDPIAVAAAIVAAGCPAHAHTFAGTYLCNHVFYQTLHHVASRSPGLPVGFLHLPYAQELERADPAAPALPLALLRTGVLAALRAVV
ncbi:MAG: hypothetical protein IT204_20815 [Fimbriimonadaceae bacterium]|nr:hypothetical protein [Fimbriimonadaceae bacterium]